MIPACHVLLLALLHLVVGLGGMLLRRSAMVVLSCGLVALTGVLLAFSAALGDSTSQAGALVVLVVAVSLGLVGCAVLYSFYRLRRTVVVDEQDRLRE